MRPFYPKFSNNPFQSTGFSLLELLIAISLSSVLLVVLVSGFNLITKSWEDQEKILDDAIDETLILVEIEKAIAGAFPYTFFEDKKEVIFFSAEQQQIQFVSTLSPSYDNQITLWYIKSIAEGGLSLQVTAQVTGDPSDQVELMSAKQNTDEATLILENYEAEFSYLSIINEQREWVANWDGSDKQSLPRAVRISLQLKDDKDKDPIYIIAPILAYEHKTIRAKKEVY